METHSSPEGGWPWPGLLLATTHSPCASRSCRAQLLLLPTLSRGPRATLCSCYGAVKDARTGEDLLAALLFDAGGAERRLSPAVVLLLRAGGVVAGGAVLALPGPAPIPTQLPLLAVRGELRGNGLGGVLHAAAEVVAGANALCMVTPRLDPGGASFARAVGADEPEPVLAGVQARLGYSPAPREVMQALAGADSLRLPGTAWLGKVLGAPATPCLPAALAWNEAVDLEWAMQQGRAATAPGGEAAVVCGIGVRAT